jgi:hypothetical protein
MVHINLEMFVVAVVVGFDVGLTPAQADEPENAQQHEEECAFHKRSFE